VEPLGCPVRQLRVLCPLRAQARIKCVAVDRCTRSSRCSASTPNSLVRHQTLSGASPDNPVNYSGAASHFPEGSEFNVECPGAPDSPVRQTRVSLFEPFLVFLLVCCEPLAPVKLID
jgi:hypothetical protein